MRFISVIVGPESVIDPIKYYKNNTINTMNPVSVMLENGVKSFVFSSTAAVYGMPEKIPVNESAPMNPINPYGTSKLMTELFLRDVAFASSDFSMRHSGTLM